MEARIERRLGEFENGLSSTLERIDAAVGDLRSADENYAYLVAERLPTLGTAALPALQRIMEDPESTGAARYLAVWVSLRVGDRADSTYVLCAEVDADTRWSLPAANALAAHRIHEGRGPVTSALARTDPADHVRVANLSAALRDLGGDLSGAARRRLLISAPPWIAKAIAQDFPEDGSED